MESSRNNHWHIVGAQSLLAIINLNVNSLEIYSEVRYEIGFSFGLSQLSQHYLFNYIFCPHQKACGCWPQSSRGNSLYRTMRMLQNSLLTLSLSTLPHAKLKASVTTGFLRVQSLTAISFPSPGTAPHNLSLATISPSLWPLGLERSLFSLTTVLP